MSISAWLRNWKPVAPAALRRTQASARQRARFRPQLEAFEDRALPSVYMSIDDVVHVESLSGQQTAYVFTVTLGAPSKQTVNVNYTTVDGTATVAGGDYVPTSGTLRFAKGQRYQTITVLASAATVGELDETFSVRLTKASNAVVVKDTGVGWILTPFFTARNDVYGIFLDSGVVDNVLSNDQDQTGGGLRVSAVDGSAANVGSTIHLASGAWLTVNPDGSFVYDPHGAFDQYYGTGRVGDYGQVPVATDTFTYTVTDSRGVQSTATVTIYIYDPSYVP